MLVEGLGGKILGHKTFKDHHAYAPSDLNELDRLAMDSGAEVLVTTEKDWVKIKAMASAVRLPLWVMRIELRVRDLTGHWFKLISGHNG